MSTDGSDGETKSTATRWPYTNDVLAAILLCSLAAIAAVGLYRDVSIPMRVWAPFASAALLAAVWAFGTQAVDALARFRG